MIKTEYTPKYLRERKKFLKNNPELLRKTTKTLRNFASNPQHPFLNLEKLRGSDIWTVRIDRGNRIFFTWIDSTTVLLLDVGKHDKYRQY